LSTAVNHLYLGQYEQAVKSALRQAAFYREGKNEWGVQLAMLNVAYHQCGLGQFDVAIARLRGALDALRQMGAPYGVGPALQMLAIAHAMRGDRDEAFANARAALPYLHRGGDPPGLLLALAQVHARHGAEHRAVSLLAFVEREFAHTGRIFFPMLAHVRDEIVSRARAALEPAEVDIRKAVGADLTEEQAVALALDESQQQCESDT
jgi:tetratricopeptide (TPR) repeat protein